MIRRRVKRLPVLRGETLVGVIVALRPPQGPAGRDARDRTPRIRTPRSRPPIQAELDKLDWAPRASVRVEVQNGVVTFDGAIIDERLREGLKVIAENTPGCVAVHDHMAWIEPNSGCRHSVGRGRSEGWRAGRLIADGAGPPQLCVSGLAVQSRRPVMAARGEEESDRPRGVRLDLRAQGGQILAEQRPAPASAAPPGRETGAPSPGAFPARTRAKRRWRRTPPVRQTRGPRPRSGVGDPCS